MAKYFIISQAKDKKTNTRYFRVVEISSGRQSTMSEEQIIESVRRNEFDNATVDKLNRLRVYNKQIKLEHNGKIRITEQLDKLMTGSPLRVRLKSWNWIQCIYSGKEGSNYLFFDNSGVSGMFSLSEKFLNNKDNSVQIDLDNNNPTEVAKLLKIFNNEY